MQSTDDPTAALIAHATATQAFEPTRIILPIDGDNAVEDITRELHTNRNTEIEAYLDDRSYSTRQGKSG
jgi:hypothetical protein